MIRKLLILIILALSMSLCGAENIFYQQDSIGQAGYYELKEYLQKIKKKQGRIISATNQPIQFYIGACEEVKTQGFDIPSMLEDQWRIVIRGNKCFLLGKGRGVFYAIAHFLEDFCNVFWYSQYEEDIFSAGKTITLKDCDISGRPFFEYRHIYRNNLGRDSGRFAVRRRLNNEDTGRIAAKFGGAMCFGPPRFVHTMWAYISEKEFAKSRPDFFALANGIRTSGRYGQLCMTHPELPAILTEKLLKNIEKGILSAQRKGMPAPRFYDLSINDNCNFCHCERCMEAVKKYGHSGILLLLLNKVAAECAEKYPDVRITTLAYNFTEAPPKGGIKAADNLIIRLCPRINLASSLLSEKNTAFRNNLIEWKKAVKKLYIWDYAATYISECIGFPYASEFYYGDKFRFYADQKVSGVMFEHPFEPEADLYELKAFLKCRLMENPYFDTEKAIPDFINKFYGKAGKHILNYRKMLDRFTQNHKAHIDFMAPLHTFYYFTDPELAAMSAECETAENVVSNEPEYFNRVRRATRGLDRMIIFNYMHKRSDILKKLANKSFVRLQDSWLKSLERYVAADKGRSASNANFELERFKLVLNSDIKTPRKFVGKKYLDFPAYLFQNHDPAALKLVADKESETGCAVKITVEKDEKFYKMPFEYGFRNRSQKITYKKEITKISEKPGYHWYSVGNFKIPKSADIYLSRKWAVKLHLAEMESDKVYEFWVSIKFQGPEFYPGAFEENAIFIDRIIGLEK